MRGRRSCSHLCFSPLLVVADQGIRLRAGRAASSRVDLDAVLDVRSNVGVVVMDDELLAATRHTWVVGETGPLNGDAVRRKQVALRLYRPFDIVGGGNLDGVGGRRCSI